jgi:nucleoside-diphosphate-sugar epimerase
MSQNRVLVTGAGGFIGGWLVKKLIENENLEVIAVDCKQESNWYQVSKKAKNIVTDLSIIENCRNVTRGVNEIYNLAADMGGMGFIENNKAKCMLSVLINTHLLNASVENEVQKYFFASSACVYNSEKQTLEHNVGLKESDAYPAMPEDGYGWEKLFSERMCRHFHEDFGLEVRIGRYHNVYGPLGTYFGGREKAPAAICRKVAESVITGKKEIEIWGDGNQSRSFMYVDDCVEGTMKLFNSTFDSPMNIGSSRLITINELVTIVEGIASVKLNRRYMLDAPQGVRGRNSDNQLIKETLGWEPTISLEYGLQKTYEWIYSELKTNNSKSL